MTISMQAVLDAQYAADFIAAEYKIQQQHRLQKIVIPATELVIANGEQYAGIMINSTVDNYHLILTKVSPDELSWQDATSWVVDVNGFLPTRSEQALLYANLKDHILKEQWSWFWSSCELNGLYAWGQDFVNGYQSAYSKTEHNYAQAVRRVPVN